MCQVEHELQVTLVSTATFADRRLGTPISKLGGKGAFSKEIQQLVMSGDADLAVHSAKDLQATTPEGLLIAAFPERGDARDALIGSTLTDLAAGANVATGSNRRRALLNDLCSDLTFHELRGNIATRVAKAEGYDAIVMAAAAIERLGINLPIVDILDPVAFVPQVGQGALAVEVRDPNTDAGNDRSIAELVAQLNHRPTELEVTAERHFLVELGGDCTLPAGAHARVDPVTEQISIDGVLADENGEHLQRLTVDGNPKSEPGRELARRLRKALEATVA